MEIYNDPISNFGTKIFEKRKDFVEKLNPIIQHYYEIISGGKENVSVIYESHLSEGFDLAQPNPFFKELPLGVILLVFIR